MSLQSVISSFFWGAAALLNHDGQLIDEISRRNPFITSSISVGCPEKMLDEENMLLSWQLGGIIGKEKNGRVWLQTEAKTWIMASPQTTLPLVYWQLRKIKSRTVTFSLNDSVLNECYDERFIEFKLKDE